MAIWRGSPKLATARRSASSSVWPALRAQMTKSSTCARNSRQTSRRRPADGIWAALTISSMRRSVRMLFAPQDRGDHAVQMLPLAFVVAGGLLAFGGQGIIFALAAVVAGAPLGLDETLFFELMQRGVEGAFLEFEGVGAAAGGLLQDFIAVHIRAGEEIQEQETDAAFEEFAIDLHTLPPKLCNTRYHGAEGACQWFLWIGYICNRDLGECARIRSPAQKQKSLRFLGGFLLRPGNFLLSHTLARAVQSGLRGLTSVFGMGTGGSLSLESPRRSGLNIDGPR